MDYRIEFYRLKLDRKAVAREMNLSYNQLSARITGFTPWGQEEIQLQEIIRKAADAQALTEKGAPRED